VNKKIFRYWNGAKDLCGDPEEILASLCEHCEYSLGHLLTQVKSENQAVSLPATNRLVHASRKAFAMEPYNAMNGAGASREDVLGVLNQFLDFCEKKNASTEVSPTLQLVTDSPE
jgi:hypothetical protein